MLNSEFKHNDKDGCHDNTLTLHDCVAERVSFSNGILRFYLSDGFWITTQHKENVLDRTVRTDAAVVDFCIKDLDDVTLCVFVRNILGKTKAEIWKMRDLINGINSGEFTIEFLYQYRSYFEQMWHCVIRSDRKPYHRECQLHLPEATAVFRWNNLRPNCEW